MSPKRPPNPELLEAFVQGVYERVGTAHMLQGTKSLPQWPECWLAKHDPEKRECGGREEIFHFLSRQRVRNEPIFFMADLDIVELAEWDPRNAEIACTNHHRPFDNQATPALVIPRLLLPNHVCEYVSDYGVEAEMERRFPA